MNCIQLFQFKKIFIIPSYKSLHVERLCMPELKPICDSYDSYVLQDISGFLKSRLSNSQNTHHNLGQKLYLSRKKAGRRKVENENEVEALLKEHGFITIYNEDYSFGDLVSIYGHTKYLVSIHGAGLTNMLFMKANSHVLELYKKITNPSDWHSLAYWYLADVLGHSYYQQVCKPISQEEHFFTANIHVDLKKLDKNIQLMLAQ